jgi:Rieske Fe-S protein
VGAAIAVTPQVALVRTGQSTFRALSMVCTHEGCLTEIRNQQLECPCHGSIFAFDGSVKRGPNVANSGIGPLKQLTATFNATTNEVTIT